MDEDKIKEILEENAKLKEELQSTKDHLKKYTAPASSKVYYEKFKMFLQEKDKLNKETTEFYKRDVWRKMKFRQYSY